MPQDHRSEQRQHLNEDRSNGPSKDGSEDRQTTQQGLVTLARYSHLGLVLPAAAFTGWLVGYGLDHWLHTAWIGLAGLALGVAAGFYELIRAAISMGKDGQGQ